MKHWRITRSLLLPLAFVGAMCRGAQLPLYRENTAVVLPPFLVVENKPWRYVGLPGYEYLSRCPDSVTKKYIERLQRLNALVDLVLPPSMQIETTAPRALILTPPSSVPTTAEDFVSDAAAIASKGGGPGATAMPKELRFFPNLALNDVDSVIVFTILDEKEVNPSKVVYTPLHIRGLLERRTPAPPRWLVAGFLRLFADMTFGTDDVVIRPFSLGAPSTTYRLRTDLDYPRPLLAMRDFFADAAGNAERGFELDDGTEAAQAALFIRWALDGKDAARQPAFWNFVAAACRAPVTEEMTKQYLGCDFAELRDRLSDYLPAAILGSVKLKLASIPEVEPVQLRDATPAEISRLIGDWQRLEIRYVKRNNPEYVPPYLRLARSTLDNALQRNPDDSALAAIYGILESDAGNDAKARPLLEKAVDRRVARPRAYLELAQLRYREALRGLAEGNAFSPVTAEAIVAPLLNAPALQPPMLDAYVLAGEVWARAQATLDGARLTWLELGAERFPSDARLLLYVAVLEARSGMLDKAEIFAARGESLASEKGKSHFAALRAAIAAARQRPTGSGPIIDVLRWSEPDGTHVP